MNRINKRLCIPIVATIGPRRRRYRARRRGHGLERDHGGDGGGAADQPLLPGAIGRDRAARRLRGGQLHHRGLRAVPGDHRRTALGLAGRRGHRRRPSHPGDPAPGQRPALDASRAQSLAAIPDGPAKDAGIAAGEAAAAAMLLLRANDGWDAIVPYTPGTDPGDWQPTPPLFAPALLPGWGQVTPFGLKEGSQFRSPPPPALHTGKYANDYNEVKLVGRIDSPFRPQDRTDVARFYAAATPMQTWNPAARQVSAAQGKTLSENARIFALLAMAMADGSIAVFDTKYFYNRWRPVTAIWARRHRRQSPKTDPDPTWLPLIATPPFPSYPSAHATLSGAARAVLERAFGKHGHAITLTNPAAAGHRPQLHRLGADHRRHRRRPDLRRHPLPVRPGGGCPPGPAGRQVHPPALSALGA